jgi:hypothetical protein
MRYPKGSVHLGSFKDEAILDFLAQPGRELRVAAGCIADIGRLGRELGSGAHNQGAAGRTRRML